MLHLKNGTYINWQTLEFTPTDIWIEEGENGKIHFSQPGNLPHNIQSIDCKGLYITRALANAHHHIYSALARGMPQPPQPPKNFHEKLQYVWWQLDYALDEDMIRSSALVTALAAAKAGCSFIIDHHSSPAHTKGSLDIIAGALEEAGLAHLLAYEITDRNGPEKAEQALEETRDYLQKKQGLVGLHASFTVDDPTLEKAIKLAEEFNTGVHAHLAEDPVDQDFCLEKYGKRVVQRYADMGALELTRNIFVHGIHLDEAERELFKKSGAHIAVNYDSNLNNKVGVFRGDGLGENIMLGTDGMHSDMFASARTAWFTGMNHEKLNPMIVYQRLRRVHHYLRENNFTGDGENNLMILDYDSPTPVNQENFAGHFFYGMNSSHVKHLISQGKLILKDRKHTLLDEKAILAEAQEQAKRLWDRLK
jgi:cytosine/adenosine deaminase-related metal-dependent hydrolase